MTATDTTSQPEPHGVLDYFGRVRGIPDTAVADLLDIHRNSVKKKRTGEISLSDTEKALLAKAFDVPVEVFALSTLDAMRWAVEERPEWFSVARPPSSLKDRRAQQLQAKLRQPAGVVQWNCMGLEAA